MKTVVALFALLLLAETSWGTQPSLEICNELDAAKLAEVYYLAMPLWEIPGLDPPESFEDLIERTGPEHFSADQGVVQCAYALGQFLVIRGLSAYDPKAYDRAMAVAPSGAEHLAPEVAQSLNSERVDLVQMGQELVWLSRVLPDVAEGDFTAFNESGTMARQTFRQSLPQLKSMFAMDKQAGEIFRSVMSSSIGVFSQLTREQVLMMARIYRVQKIGFLDGERIEGSEPALEILALNQHKVETQAKIETEIYKKEGSASAVPTETEGKVVDVYYSTTRKRSGVSEPNFFYGGEAIPNGALMDIGVVKVSIPPAHAKGQIERPWKFVSIEFQEYANEHVVILKPKPLSWEQFRTSLATSLASTNGKAFVFVHGYNTTFAEAARKTAQMAVDLEIRITPVMFSWASLGKPWRYADDVENARSAAKYLEEFLEKLASQTGAKEVHLVAHSLGNDPLTTALERMALKSAAQREYAWPFGEVVLAAPDVNRNLFESAVTAFQRIVRHTTSYVSSKDWALKISRFFRPSTTRAGDTSHGITLVPGIDTIDVSAIENISWLETGHGYITENPLVLRDLYDIIKAGLRPSERFGLNPMPHGATLPTYWSFVPMRR